MLEACPNVELTTVLDAAHVALIERPDLIAQLILQPIEAAPDACNRMRFNPRAATPPRPTFGDPNVESVRPI